MATRETLQREPATLNRAILLQRLDCVLRAGGRIAARRRGVGRDAVLIELDQRQQGQSEESFKHA